MSQETVAFPVVMDVAATVAFPFSAAWHIANALRQVRELKHVEQTATPHRHKGCRCPVCMQLVKRRKKIERALVKLCEQGYASPLEVERSDVKHWKRDRRNRLRREREHDEPDNGDEYDARSVRQLRAHAHMREVQTRAHADHQRREADRTVDVLSVLERREGTPMSELREGEKEVTVHVERSDRIVGGVAVEFRQVTSPNARWAQRIHISYEEADKLSCDLKDLL